MNKELNTQTPDGCVARFFILDLDEVERQQIDKDMFAAFNEWSEGQTHTFVDELTPCKPA